MLWLANYLEREMDLMYKLLKKAFIGCMLFGLMSATASAETINVPGNKISYDYGNNKIGITQDTEKEKQQLTVLLVQGNVDENTEITGEKIYYVDQTEGTSFVKAFSNLGVKGGKLPAGTYTLIAGGNNVGNGFKETVIIGDVDSGFVKNKMGSTNNVTFYTNRDTVVHPNDDKSKYAYATVSDFGKFDEENSGWLLQYINKDNTVLQLVKKTSDLTNNSADNVESIKATVSVGLQINGITDDMKDFVAIPFTLDVTEQ